jgi:hypothetical protein
MGATNKLWFGIPVIVRNTTVCFDYYPLRSFSEDTIIFSFAFTIFKHYTCENRNISMARWWDGVKYKLRKDIDT